MPAPRLQIWKEVRHALLRLPVVLIAVGAGLALVILAILAVIIVIVRPSSATADQQRLAQSIYQTPAGQIQAIVGMARCLNGSECPTSSPTSDLAKVVAKTSTINGRTLTPENADGWNAWARAFNTYGLIQQDSVVALSDLTGSQTVQVTTDHSSVMMCTAAWNNEKQLTYWNCSPPSPSSEGLTPTPTPQPTVEPPYTTPTATGQPDR